MPDKPLDNLLKFSGDSDPGVKFRNPFNDFASKMLPDDIKEALDFAEFMWFANSTFSKGCSTAARYFITELEFDIKDDKKSTALKDLLIENIDILKLCGLLGDDLLCYSNSFWSVILPFDRNLQCTETGNLFPIEIAIRHNLAEWKNWEFVKTSDGIKKCDGSKAKFKIVDQPSSDVNKLIFKRWRPQDIDITVDEWSGSKTYFWKIPPSFANDIKTGKTISLINTPIEVIDAIKKDSKRFEFKKDELLHLADDTVAGVVCGGWGIPLIIKNFRTIYRSQLLDRYDEAVNLDYITGLRVITPAASGTGTAADPIKNMGMDKFSNTIGKMIEKHRADPTTWHTSPTPLTYTLMGAEGSQLTPVDLKERADQNILNSIGVPQELYRMNLQTQAAPLALRLFEKMWPHITSAYNKFLNWSADKIATRFKHPRCKINMKKVTLADDLTLREIMLQLMSGQQVSPQTALATLGIGDYREQVRKIYESEKIRAEEESKFQEEMAQEQAYQEFKAKLEEAQVMAQGGMPVQGGMPPSGGGMGAPAPGPMAPPAGPGSGVQVNQAALTDPIAMQAEAQRIAQQIFPDPNRRSIISDLTKTNNTLAAVVKEELRKIEQQASSMGIQQAKQQGGI